MKVFCIGANGVKNEPNLKEVGSLTNYKWYELQNPPIKVMHDDYFIIDDYGSLENYSRLRFLTEKEYLANKFNNKIENIINE